MFWKGNILVDGGVLNNLPADVMREKFGGVVIAVDVSRQADMRAPESVHEVPSGWHILWSKLNPIMRTIDVPSIFDILYQTATLSSNCLAKRAYELVDMVIAPPLERYGILSFDAIDELVEIGYRHTIEQLDSLDSERLRRIMNKSEGVDRPVDLAKAEAV
jgi:predicted acylesterase/phospholipase RssA